MSVLFPRRASVHDMQAKRAKRTDEATSPPAGTHVTATGASRANHRPMDAPRRLASRPRHVRHGPMMRMRARHPTRNRVYTPHSPRVWRISKVSEKNKQTPGDLGRLRAKVQKPAETTFWARPAHEGLPTETGPSLAGRFEGAGDGPCARPRPPRRPHGQVCRNFVRVRRLKTRSRRAGPM